LIEEHPWENDDHHRNQSRLQDYIENEQGGDYTALINSSPGSEKEGELIKPEQIGISTKKKKKSKAKGQRKITESSLERNNTVDLMDVFKSKLKQSVEEKLT
jgi:hypothetical protein